MTFYVQLGLFENIKAKKKRIRYKIPTYTKFYSIWQYDRNKFKNLINDRKLGLNNYTQAEILEMCFIRDDMGRKQRDSDEKHIFRIAVLHRIHHKLYKLYEKEPLIFTRFNNTMVIYSDDEQAEIVNTWQLPIYERLKMHIELLRAIKREFKNSLKKLC